MTAHTIQCELPVWHLATTSVQAHRQVLLSHTLDCSQNMQSCSACQAQFHSLAGKTTEIWAGAWQSEPLKEGGKCLVGPAKVLFSLVISLWQKEALLRQNMQVQPLSTGHSSCRSLMSTTVVLRLSRRHPCSVVH